MTFGLLSPVKRQVQHWFECPAGLIGKCVDGECVSFCVRDYGAIRKTLRGFLEVGSRNCKSFVCLDVGYSVCVPDSVSLFDRGLWFEVHEARRD